MTNALPILFVMTRDRKQKLLEKHGYTVSDTDEEEDLDHTITEDVVSGEIRIAELGH